jgi:hypothetical protein
MSDSSSRYIKIDNWFFEIKTVRALKVDEYGKPYSAIANCSVNGDQLYIDGLMTKSDEDFTKEDLLAFYKFCKKMGIRSCQYDRYQNGKLVSKEMTEDKVEKHVNLMEDQNKEHKIRLVK